MKPYLLLTPGPLTTSETVKEAMMTDWCTWDADYNVHIVEEIRKSLVALATTATDEYTSVCLLYTSPSPRDRSLSRMPSSA